MRMQEYVDQEMEKSFSRKVIAYLHNPVNMARMTDPDGSAVMKGSCGDTMEMYLIIDDECITEIRFYTDGCGFTLVCGSAVSEMVKGKSIHDAMKIAPYDLIDCLDGLPRDGIHCAILAVCTLQKAIADYLLRTG